ncbi:unnamed protein product [Parascedosporium putredinis]|uniref:DUF829-domain-containing protein n=1 Tax=Parascedosporium putredinis TaxID=1442378 RepID=A0A9P1MFS8_9PEZI|nr:unnamed protein product [Parascedosporium putredinis]CAI8004107.1 unnamed protein product [Parascedosporium putredinis]
MASNAPSPAGNPLAAFERLSPTSFLYRPKEATRDPSAPKLIALFTWMAAQDAHIAKYVVGYQAAYPSSPILLVKAPLENVLRPGKAKVEVAPAVPAMKSILGDSGLVDEDKPELLLHPPRFPTHVSAMDSCPGQFDWARSYKALSQPMPQWMRPLAHLVVFGFIVYYWFAEPVAADRGKMGKQMNAGDVIDAGLRRVYLFSDGDEMVAAKDVESHGKEAEAKGLDVRLENFGGSPHVAHMRTDGNRYWGAIKGVWDGW